MQLVKKQFKNLASRAVELILGEYSGRIANINDPQINKKSQQILNDVKEIGKLFDLVLYEPQQVIILIDDEHGIFRIFPNGVIVTSTVI